MNITRSMYRPICLRQHFMGISASLPSKAIANGPQEMTIYVQRAPEGTLLDMQTI